jgi:hypothetical protein
MTDIFPLTSVSTPLRLPTLHFCACAINVQKKARLLSRLARINPLGDPRVLSPSESARYALCVSSRVGFAVPSRHDAWPIFQSGWLQRNPDFSRKHTNICTKTPANTSTNIPTYQHINIHTYMHTNILCCRGHAHMPNLNGLISFADCLTVAFIPWRGVGREP